MYNQIIEHLLVLNPEDNSQKYKKPTKNLINKIYICHHKPLVHRKEYLEKRLISKGLSQVTLTSLNVYLLPLVSVKVVPPMESHPTIRKEKKANKNVFLFFIFRDIDWKK